MLKRPVAGTGAAPLPGTGGEALAVGGPSTLNVLKEELFTLETERLQGKISEGEYAEHKTALEQVLRRVLNRGGSADVVRAEPMAADLVARSGLKS